MLKNKTAEKDIRDYLSDNGYYGRTAQFEELELHAIERPGWLQIMRFTVRAKSKQDHWVQLFGVLKDDERFKICDIQCFQKRAQRDVLLNRWSDGLIQQTNLRNTGESHGAGRTAIELIILFAVIAVLLGLLSLLA